MANIKKGFLRKREIEAENSLTCEVPCVTGFSTGKQVVTAAMQRLEDFCRAPEKGISLDIFPPGLLPGRLTLICSVPNMGKTAYLANIVSEIACAGLTAAVFLPNNTQAEFGTMLLTIRSGVEFRSIMHSSLMCESIPRDEWLKLTAVKKEISRSGIYFSESAIISGDIITEESIRLATELKKAGRRLDAVIIGPLNYIEDFDFGSLLRKLRITAADCETSVICALGVSESKNIRNGSVRLGDVRAAGVDEKETDLIYNMLRPEYFDRMDPTLRGLVSMECVYSKNIRVNNFSLWFNADTLTLTNLLPTPAAESVVF